MDSRILALAFVVVVFGKTLALQCPRGCHCLSDANQESKLSCKWSHIPPSLANLTNAAGADTGFDKVTSLMIRCSNDQPSVLESAIFNHFPSLRGLDIRGCHSRTPTLTGNFLRGLTQLRTLNLQEIRPQQGQLIFNKHIFEGLSKLEKLTVKQSRLKTFPTKLLCKLPELKMLDLAENDIPDLAPLGADSVSCSSQLILLNLTANRISNLKGSDVGRLQTLMVLELSQNQITSIAENAFSMVSNLKELYIAANQLSTVPNLPDDLGLLDISGNELENVPKILLTMTRLRVLLLSGNKIQAIDASIMGPNNSLQKLSLHSNRITSITPNAFEMMTKLTELDISTNHLRTLETGVFWQLGELKTLSLANNHLRGANGSHLEGLTNIASLDLSNNSLVSLAADVLSDLKNLKSLSLRDNLLSDIPSSISALYHLTELDLSANQISGIRKGLFTKLPNLERLNISNNRLTTIERYVFEDMGRLSSLDLSSNEIAKLSPGCLTRCPNLATVRVDANRLVRIDGVFDGQLRGLRLLNVSANRLAVLPVAELAGGLRTLLAAGNRLQQLFGSAARLTALEVVDLSDNRLLQLSADNVAPRLRHVRVNNNSIAKILPGTFAHCSRLESVDLRFNRLVTLPSAAFGDVAAVRRPAGAPKVSVYGNPFDCDCGIEWMRTQMPALVDQRPFVTDIDRTTCRNILTDELNPIKKTPLDQFLCQYESVCLARCPCCRLPGCGCNNVCPVGCSCYRDQSDKANIVNCTGVNVDTKSLPMEATSIYITKGSINRLDSNAFMSIYKLKKLILRDNNISQIAKQAFNNLNNLEILDLSHNQLNAVTGYEFYRVETLKHLFLDNNRIEQVGSLKSLPNLQYLTLHQNHLADLPIGVKEETLKGVTLARNRWRCDCDGRFDLQWWLPRRRDIVGDAASVYCYENITAARLDNDTTILSSLPPSDGSQLVKVNFWTFRDQINRTLCHGATQSPLDYADNNEDEDRAWNPIVLLVLVLITLTAVFVCLLVVVRCACKHIIGGTSTRKSPPSVNSSLTNSTPIPPLYAPAVGATDQHGLLHYDAFIAYSAADRKQVEGDLAHYLQQQAFEVCLLHRELRGAMQTCNHLISDELISAMRRSQSLVVCVSGEFVRGEWCRPDVCTAIKTFVQSRRRIIFLLLPNYQLTPMDPALGHYLRTNVRVDWLDAQMRQKVAEAIPNSTYESVNAAGGGVSNHYSDMYGRKVDWV